MTKAKDFKLADQDGKMHSLSDYKGQNVLLYFYPNDMTPFRAHSGSFGRFEK